MGCGFFVFNFKFLTSKKERKQETKNLRKLVISNESKAKCCGTSFIE